MGEKHLENDSTNSSKIVINHIELYLKKMSKVLFFALIAVTIAETIILLLVKNGHFTYYLKMQNSHSMTYQSLLLEVIIHNTITWLIFGIYCICFVHSSYKTRKILFSITFMLITSILCFGHWKYSYLSIIYSIPICVTSPMGKKHSYLIFSSCIIITILYACFQSSFFSTEYNFLICVVSVLVEIVFFLISRIFFSSMTSAIYDIEKYCHISEDLTEQVDHDALTSALSKRALYKDFEDLSGFASMAFLDLDNFKHINDSLGHSFGDYILKALVRCFKVKNEKIYRYGGDEFVILSKLSVEDFKNELFEIKKNFVSIANKVLNCDTSFSAGVVNVVNNDNLLTLIRKCDKAMYEAKKNGKNSITISEECDY